MRLQSIPSFYLSLLSLMVLLLGTWSQHIWAAEQQPFIIIDGQQAHIQVAHHQVTGCSTLMSVQQPSPFTHAPCQWTHLNTEDDWYRGISAKTTWVKLVLHNPTDQPVQAWLSTGHPRLEQVRVWQDQAPEVTDIGAHTPIAQRPIQTAKPIFPVHLTPYEQRVLMIGYASQTYINTRIDIWQPQAYLQQQMHKQFYQSLAMGGILLAFLFSLLVYFALRDSAYLFFAIALMVELFHEMTFTGLLITHIWPSSLPFYTPFLSIMAMSALFFYLLFLNAFVQPLRQHLWFGKLLWTLMLFTGIAILYGIFIDYRDAIMFWSPAMFSILLSIVLMMAWLWYKGSSHAKLLTIAFGVVFIIESMKPLAILLGFNLSSLQTELGPWSILLTTPLVLLSIILRTKSLEKEVMLTKQENDAKTKFLREVNHEIRAPLNRVLNQALEIDRPNLREKIIQNCRHVMLTIDEALSYSNNMRPLAKADQTLMTWQEWLTLIRDSGREIVEQTYRDHHNRFGFSAHFAGYPFIMLDERRVMQIVDNLITNAARYTHEGSIDITLSGRYVRSIAPQVGMVEEAAELIIKVKDTGAGISSEDQIRIFEPLVRGNAGLTSGCKGAGMGLAIVKQLTAQLSGSIHLESTEGKGSCFTLKIPIYPASQSMYENYRETHYNHLKSPDSTQLKHLYQLIQQGGISDIIRWAQQLSQNHTDYQPFASEVIQAATKGDMARLRQLTKP